MSDAPSGLLTEFLEQGLGLFFAFPSERHMCCYSFVSPLQRMPLVTKNCVTRIVGDIGDGATTANLADRNIYFFLTELCLDLFNQGHYVCVTGSFVQFFFDPCEMGL